MAGKATFLLLNVCIVKQWALRFDRVNANQAAVLLPEGSSGGRGGWRCVCGQVAWAAVRVHAGTDLRCQVKAFRWSNLTVLLIESRLRAPLHSTCSKQKKKNPSREQLLNSPRATQGPVCQTKLASKTTPPLRPCSSF